MKKKINNQEAYFSSLSVITVIAPQRGRDSPGITGPLDPGARFLLGCAESVCGVMSRVCLCAGGRAAGRGAWWRVCLRRWTVDEENGGGGGSARSTMREEKRRTGVICGTCGRACCSGLCDAAWSTAPSASSPAACCKRTQTAPRSRLDSPPSSAAWPRWLGSWHSCCSETGGRGGVGGGHRRCFKVKKEEEEEEVIFGECWCF